MFGKRSFASSKERSGKISKQPKRSFREASKQKHMLEKMDARKDSPMSERYGTVTVDIGTSVPDLRLIVFPQASLPPL